ncbi:aspartic peptidase domain-containing protein [Rhodotorula diobovata]|uniref:Aspartic peptidase domain-containing protein n=1 Tax=Rhodotorula diobovata TaxID=5288 RepID=A0A5C5G679_9BASI|nr:aspartic peptidase domain-containing protein [Rhodotorula diobovata]
MPSLAALLPLALVPAAALSAPVKPAHAAPAPIRIATRAPPAGALTRDQFLERQVDSFARLARGAKRGASIAPGLHKRGKTATVPLKLHYNEYQGLDSHAAEIKIGGQSLPVLFDTGSPDLVVPVDCESGCSNGFFKTSKSKTFVKDGRDVSVSYGTGAATGYVAEDTVQVAGLTVEKQVFAAATKLDTAGGENWSGIFGLSPGGGAYTGGPSFIQRLIQDGALASNEFSLSLGGSKPELVLGGVDSSRIQADLVTVPNLGAASGIWLAGIGATTVDNNVVDEAVSYALVDSGSSFNAIPRSAAAAIYAKVNGTLWQTQRMTISGIQADVDIYTVPCSPSPDSGRVGFSFVGASSPTPVSMSSKTNVLEYADEESKERCFAATYGADVEMIPGSGMSGALLGMPFLKSVLTVFSFDNAANGVSMAFSGVKTGK